MEDTNYLRRKLPLPFLERGLKKFAKMCLEFKKSKTIKEQSLTSDTMKTVITIPAFNEEKTIGALLDKLKQVIHQNGYNAKILLVDDGSKDRTTEIAKSKGAIVF